MKRFYFGFMLFIGGLSLIITIINSSYKQYGSWRSDEFGGICVFFSLITIAGLIICFYEAYRRDDD